MAIPLLDIMVILLYLALVVGLGLWVGRGRGKNAAEYFLANRALRWPVIGAALFASNISTVHLVGLAASGFEDGLVWGNFEWMAVFILILLGLVFAPFYFHNKVTTLPEYLERRYNPFARICLAILGLLGALFIHIGVSLYAGAVVFEYFFGIPIYGSIILISILTTWYTVVGGLRSVVVTETLQTLVLLTGSVVLTILAIRKLPEVGIHHVAALFEAVKPEQLRIVPGPDNSSGLTWSAVLLGYPILGVWYWCADQTIVQRVLGARTRTDAQTGPLFAGFLKILPVFLMVLPGVLGYVLFGDLIQDPNDTLPVLITQLLPTGLQGLLSAALLAALMSTIAAALNSAATLVTMDIAVYRHPDLSEKKKVQVGRWTAIVVMVIAVLWSPLIARFDSIFEAINVLLTVISPPITTVFIWGVFWRRGNGPAAIATFVFGFVLGLIAFLVDFPVIGTTKVLTDVLGISFMMQAWWLFVVCSVVYVITAWQTKPPDYSRIAPYTLSAPGAFLRGSSTQDRQVRFVAFLLASIMVLLYFLLSR